MKKILILIVFTSYLGYSQVGVGTTAPDSTLDIVAANPTGASTNVDGILIPRVDRNRAILMSTFPAVTPTGTLIFINSLSSTATGTAVNITTNNSFYFYDGTVWQKVATGASTDWALTGNSGTTAGTNFIGTTDAKDLRFKTGGADKLNISDTNGQLQSYTTTGSATTPSYSFSGTQTSTGMFNPAADNLGFSAGGTERFRIPNANQVHAMSPGTALLPFYSFSADTNTGLFNSGADNLDLSTGGTARFRIPNADQVHALSLGTAALPFYSFSSQTGTGLFGAATNVLGFSTAGTEKARFLSTGQLGIGTPTPQGILDITSATNGILVPRVSLGDIITAAPVVNPQGGALVAGTLVWNTATAGTFPNNVIPGFYYWNGSIWISVTGAAANSWSLTGNGGTNGGTTVLAGTNFIGTVDAQNMDIRTNNAFRGRFSALGEFLLGTLNTAFVGDLLSAVANSSFPWAVNGYTDQSNGGGVSGTCTNTSGGVGVYGETANAPGAGVFGVANVSNGTGVYGTSNGTLANGVLGFSSGSGSSGLYGSTNAIGGSRGVTGYTTGTSSNSYGVLGINAATASGTAFTSTACVAGVYGNAVSSGNYKFGVYGYGGNSTRSGGVIGNEFGFARGALGYYSSGFADYSFYGFGTAAATGTGAAAGRMAAGNLEKNAHIGIGVYGGVMGGWVRGLKYGFHTKGETYSLYVDGNGYTNKPLTLLTETDSEKVVSYMSTSMKPEITCNGKSRLVNGKVYVSFNIDFNKVIDNPEDIIINITPQGNSKGVYVSDITKEGFWVYENQEGTSTINLFWSATGNIKGTKNQEVPVDLLDKDFDKKMDGVMSNDNDPNNNAQPIWWDGTKIRWDSPNIARKPIITSEEIPKPKLALSKIPTTKTEKK